MLAFKVVTGFKVFHAKSYLFSVNVDSNTEELAEIMGCKVENFIIVYSGLPLGVKNNTQMICQGVLDRFAKKLIPLENSIYL